MYVGFDRYSIIIHCFYLPRMIPSNLKGKVESRPLPAASPKERIICFLNGMQGNLRRSRKLWRSKVTTLLSHLRRTTCPSHPDHPCTLGDTSVVSVDIMATTLAPVVVLVYVVLNAVKVTRKQSVSNSGIRIDYSLYISA